MHGNRVHGSLGLLRRDVRPVDDALLCLARREYPTDWAGPSRGPRVVRLRVAHVSEQTRARAVKVFNRARKRQNNFRMMFPIACIAPLSLLS